MRGRGGIYGLGQQRKPQEAFDIQNNKINLPNEVMPLQYSYVVVGGGFEISNAIKGINRTIKKYLKVQDYFDSQIRDQYKEVIDRIKADTAVYVSLGPT